jgi:ribokinase
MANICILGDINADLTTKLAHYPNEGDDSEIQHIQWCSGGSATNSATAFALLGEQVRLLACVGQDPAATIGLQAARQAGVELDAIQYHPSVATGVCIVSVSDSGQRTFSSFRGANVELDGSAWDVSCFGGAHHFHLSAYALLSGSQQTTALHCIQLANKHKIPVSIDLCTLCARQQGPLLKQLLPSLSLIFMNEQELALLQPNRPQHMAIAELIDAGVGCVVLKRGAAGCTVVTANEYLELHGLEVSTVDTNGCGDAFVAGFLFARLRGQALLSQAAMGNLLGALTATRVGAADALPNTTELQAAYQRSADWVGQAALQGLFS